MLSDLPSVSVCIPVRNETHAMTQCLERVIATRYPKLEIIVLDDNSADDTSILIKSFAHAGVRFVEGSPLPDGWLGKNHALQGLLKEASGSYILFMDVDTQIQPDTVEQLIAYMKQEQAAMISVMPLRQDGWRASVLFGTLRYYWELVLHRPAAPAVASSVWMIHRQTLITQLGGFEPIKAVVQPEATLAASLSVQHHYRFLMSTRLLGVSYEKKWRSQVDTGVRLLFPIFGGKVGKASVAVAILVLLNIPTIGLIFGLWQGWTMIQTLSVAVLSMYGGLYVYFLSKFWARSAWVGIITWPYLIAQELVVVVLSIRTHLRHRVTWKGRPVTSGRESQS